MHMCIVMSLLGVLKIAVSGGLSPSIKKKTNHGNELCVLENGSWEWT